MLPLLLSALAMTAGAQRPSLTAAVRGYVRVDTSGIAISHVRVIVGTGAAAREDQTVVIRDGMIATVGDTASVAVPDGALHLDLAGRTVIPRLVMVHEHLHFPTGPGIYGNLTESFSRLYLAGALAVNGGRWNG